MPDGTERLSFVSSISEFDMAKECENETFTRLLGAGVEVENAYKAVHFNEITQGLMAQTERDTKKKLRIQSDLAMADRPKMVWVPVAQMERK